jgi:hypothetical protein
MTVPSPWLGKREGPFAVACLHVLIRQASKKRRGQALLDHLQGLLTTVKTYTALIRSSRISRTPFALVISSSMVRNV